MRAFHTNYSNFAGTSTLVAPGFAMSTSSPQPQQLPRPSWMMPAVVSPVEEQHTALPARGIVPLPSAPYVSQPQLAATSSPPPQTPRASEGSSDYTSAIVEYTQAMHSPDRSAVLNTCAAPFSGAFFRVEQIVGMSHAALPTLLRMLPPHSVPAFPPPGRATVVLVVGCVPYSFGPNEVAAVVVGALTLAGAALPLNSEWQRPFVLAARPQLRRETAQRKATLSVEERQRHQLQHNKSGLWFVEVDAAMAAQVNALRSLDNRVLLSDRHVVVAESKPALRAWVDARDAFLRHVMAAAPSARGEAHTRFSKGLQPMTVQECHSPHARVGAASGIHMRSLNVSPQPEPVAVKVGFFAPPPVMPSLHLNHHQLRLPAVPSLSPAMSASSQSQDSGTVTPRPLPTPMWNRDAELVSATSLEHLTTVLHESAAESSGAASVAAADDREAIIKHDIDLLLEL